MGWCLIPKPWLPLLVIDDHHLGTSGTVLILSVLSEFDFRGVLSCPRTLPHLGTVAVEPMSPIRHDGRAVYGILGYVRGRLGPRRREPPGLLSRTRELACRLDRRRQ
jgi:hypothetical protein